MDESADAEGNYTLVARREISGGNSYGIFPVGVFINDNGPSNPQLPVRILFFSYLYGYDNFYGFYGSRS